jgi:hypothetical protein
VLFVIAARSDLRDEFYMADEAFALSPISARAALPREEDYAAISEAFMETSRGRWFLGEYAKRNRNADTSMVLDAVARIEQSLAAQKEESLAAQQQAAADTGQAEAKLAEAKLAEAKLAEVLAAIRGAVETAQASAIGAIEDLALEQKLAPVRKGARVIREIAWRLREIGNDGRICDLIDSQVGVIEAGAAQISSVEAKAALDAAFASIAERFAEFSDDEAAAPVSEAPAPAAEAAVNSPSPAPQEMTSVAAVETIKAANAQEAAPVAEAVHVEPAQETSQVATSTFTSEPEAAFAEAEDVDITDDAADAQDEAVLDMIAMEMGAPDEFDGEEMADPELADAYFAEPAPVEPEMIAQAPEPVAAPIAPPVEILPPPVIEAAPEPALEISLGSSIIANGLVRKPVAANDPLAPIRRMSQAEKIAFFS